MAAPLTVTHTATAELPFLEERGPERAREKVISVEPSVDTSHPLALCTWQQADLGACVAPSGVTLLLARFSPHSLPSGGLLHAIACWLDPRHFITASGSACEGCLLTTLAACPEHLGHQEWCQAFLTEKASS